MVGTSHIGPWLTNARQDATTDHGHRPTDGKALGFPKAGYTVVERERRWLCRNVPRERALRTEAITDLYVSGTRLRLREARPIGGDPADAPAGSKGRRRPSYEADHLDLPARGRVRCAGGRPARPSDPQASPGIVLSVDAFQGDLAELFMVEVEFDTAEMMASFAMKGCAFREVATDPRFTGGSLARNGRPKDV